MLELRVDVKSVTGLGENASFLNQKQNGKDLILKQKLNFRLKDVSIITKSIRVHKYHQH